jgi:hypothetical protein
MVPWEQYKYAVYAELRGWTPAQVDDLTLEQDAWLIPIWEAMGRAREHEQKRREKEASDAQGRRKRKGML